MKSFLNYLLLAGFILVVASPAPTRAQDPATPGTLIWCGLDYSKVKMIGNADFRKPGEIFPGMLIAWNALFMKEMLPRLESMAKSVRTDLKSVQARNEKATPNQIIREDGTREEMVTPTHITDADIAETVRSYDLKHDQGLGLVFIIDRLVKSQQTGCLYVVFFDVATRKVLSSERVIAQAGGAGFRNYWFKPIKIAVEQLPKKYKKLRGKN